MKLYPAIDIKAGRAVRLLHGRADAVTDYGTPAEMAQRWKAQGAAWLHVVDLDGAFTGVRENAEQVRRIVAETGLSVQLGGGIRTLADIETLLTEVGVQRVIVGTAAIAEPSLLTEAEKLWPSRIAVGIDARDGKVALRGWVQDSGVTALDLALRVRDVGIETIIYTDISRDGALTGPNVAATESLALAVPDVGVIGSGGVSSLNDLDALSAAGCAGAILGKALYEGKFTLAQALARFN